MTKTDVEVAYNRIADVFSFYAHGFGDYFCKLVRLEKDRLGAFANNVVSDRANPESFFNAVEYSKETIDKANPPVTYSEKVVWKNMWEEIGQFEHEPAVTNESIKKARNRMNIVFSKYEVAWEGRIRLLVNQANDYMNDIFNTILSGIVPVEEIGAHVETAKQGIYRMASEPTEQELAIWESMWKEIG